MDSACSQCAARCCRYFCFEIDKPRDYEAFENIRWFVLHQGVTVHIDEGRWYMAIDNPCKAVGPDNRCTMYESRPMICRTYETDGCDAAGGDYEYDQLFSTPEQIEEHARKALGEAAFERARAKAQGRPAQAKSPRKVPARTGSRAGGQ